ncbi:MAG: aquaporin [Dehalococcoidia bacterium]
MTPNPTQRLLAEAAGTFILVFAGTGAIIVDERSDADLGQLGIGLVFGLAIAVGVFTTRRVSGAHFNPAISLGLSVIGRFRYRAIAPYVAAQLAGAIAASLLLRALFGDVADLGATVPDGALWKAFLIEVTITSFLAFVIARVASEASLPDFGAALAIGGAVALGALLGGPLTGGSMNPARSFAPALVSLTFESNWLYWLAPAVGAVVGMVAFAIIDGGRTEAASE